MKIVLLVVSFFSSITCIAQPPVGYYNSASNQTCANLKTALSSIINNGNTPQSYGNLWNQYLISDIKPRTVGAGSSNVIFDIYSWRPTLGDPYQYTPSVNQCSGSSPNAENGCYNREHSVPVSWFNGSTSNNGPATDYLHVFPSDSWVNSKRANYIYGEVATASFTSLAGNKLGTSSIAGFSGPVFEPIDSMKGDLARAFLYFVTMYQSDMISFAGNAEAAQSFDASTFPSVKINYLKLMLKWHNQDPVSAKEIARNNAAYTFQGNRNPFVDSAKYVTGVWNAGCPGLAALPVDLLFFEGRLDGNFVKLNWEVGTENNVKEYVIERSANGQDFKTIATVTAKGKNSYSFNDAIENLNGRRIYYRIRKVDNDGSFKYSEVFTIHVPLNVSFSIYPNPVKGNLMLSFTKEIDNFFAFSITDIAGKLVLQNTKQNSTGKQAVLNVSSLKSGTYILKISTNGIEKSQKFVVVN